MGGRHGGMPGRIPSRHFGGPDSWCSIKKEAMCTCICELVTALLIVSPFPSMQEHSEAENPQIDPQGCRFDYFEV